jgi:hypothetical protein
VWDLPVAWFVGLSLGVALPLGALCIAEMDAALSLRGRRFLFAVGAFLAFGTAFPVGATGLFLFLFGATGYCEESYASSCVPDWWTFVGLALFAVVVGLFYLTVRGIKGYRRLSQLTKRARDTPHDP